MARIDGQKGRRSDKAFYEKILLDTACARPSILFRTDEMDTFAVKLGQHNVEKTEVLFFGQLVDPSNKFALNTAGASPVPLGVGTL